MIIKKLVFGVFVLTMVLSTANAQESKVKIKQIAAQFVKGADVNDGKLLEDILEPKSIQYVLIGGKLNTFSAQDYIKMVNEKQLGGKPREITYRHAEFLSKNLAVVVLNAVSEEYNFLYQLSMAKMVNGEWRVVGVTTEINGA